MTAPGRRVRLESPAADGRQGRTGCLALGAVLGVIAGIIVALYVLPPVLKSLYGEEDVPAGEARTVDGRTLQVVAYRVGVDPVCLGTSIPACPAETIQVHVRVTSDRDWDPRADQWRVEVKGVETWLEALPSVQVYEDTGLNFAPGTERIAVLRFPMPLGSRPDDVEPEGVHLTTPRVRLLLDRSLRR